MRSRLALVAVILFVTLSSFAQERREVCNLFDSATIYLNIDTASSWDIGVATKPELNMAYSLPNSIVTNIDSVFHPKNDTSRFVFAYRHLPDGGLTGGGLAGLPPLEVEFMHKFSTDDVDFGMIEISINENYEWYGIYDDLTNVGRNFHIGGFSHVNQSSGMDLGETLPIQGNSDGWIRSKFYVFEYEFLLDNNDYRLDSVLIRFSFISGTSGSGSEGWQIDDICANIDFVNGITEIASDESFSIYPNPNNGAFQLPNTLQSGKLQVFNLMGELVHNGVISTNELSLNLSLGCYLLVVEKDQLVHTSRMIVK